MGKPYNRIAGIKLHTDKTYHREVVMDKELLAYRNIIGEKQFRLEYHRLYSETRNTPDKRYSGKDYKNTSDKLKAIKKKYKNGVTKEHIEEMLREIE